ncbi:MAG: ceramidase domain-containing protein [Pseudomonadota bacterium]|nr:ceramidase domain-containing protein [Pseudomonadota bacterium]
MTGSYIDLYCERTGPEYWSEPVNALTNIGFLISAIAVTRIIYKVSRTRSFDGVHWLFNGLIYVIGIGSWLFHTHATRWAMLSDIIPIAIFILLYVWFALRRFAAAPRLVCLGCGAAVLGVATAVPALTGYGGGAYIAALVFMIATGGYLCFKRTNPGGSALLWAAAVFSASLLFRTLDIPVCTILGTGTHFVWHLLNAVVLFLVVRALILHGKRT